MEEKNLENNSELCSHYLSSERYLHAEIKQIESISEKVNNYPKYVMSQLSRGVKLKHTENMNIERSTINQTALNE